MQRRFRLLAALLVIAVMQNGISAAPLFPDVMQGATGHAHHGHDGMSHHDSGKATSPGKGDCCDSGTCKCGCAVTSPAAANRPAPTVRDWARIAAVRSQDAVAEPTGTTGAPYRPPA